MMKRLLFLATLIAMLGTVNAVQDFNVTVNLPGDTNYLFPSGSTTTIAWDVNHAGDPGDVNFQLYYSTSAGGEDTLIVDVNAADQCASPALTTTRRCTYTWTLPTDLDNNFFIDINASDNTYPVVNSEQEVSGNSFYTDTNACTTVTSIATSPRTTVTLVTTCSGYGQDGNFGGPITSYLTNRNRSCSGSFTTYSAPFTLGFGEFTICHNSVDSLGNNEATNGTTLTADSAALNLALLVEVILVAMLLIVIAGFLVTRDALDRDTMVMLAMTAISLVVLLIVYATIL